MDKITLDTLNQAQKVTENIREYGILVTIAGIFLVLVIVAISFLAITLINTFKEQNKDQKATIKDYALSLKDAADAMRENSEVYRGVKETHEFLDNGMRQVLNNTANIADINMTLTKLENSIEELNAQMKFYGDNNYALITSVNQLRTDFNILLKKLSKEE